MTVIHLEGISKQYRLGSVGSNTLTSDLNRFWAKIRGKEDPTLKLGVENKLDTIDGDYVWALRDINFGIQQGEVLGIIGKNGAGKSTLLKILSKVTAPTKGVVKIKGRIASLLEVGTGFHPDLTGRENTYLNGAILGMTKNEIRKKFDEIVAFSGVEKYIDTPVKRYSSGMYVRLAFAVAAHLEPEILIVDEVLSVGDAEFQKKCLGKMKDVGGSGRTVLFVSHNMAAVKSLCNRGILLSNGRITGDGGIEKIISLYTNYGLSNSYDKTWMEDNPKNSSIELFRVHIADEKNEIKNSISTDDDFYVVIDYKVVKDKAIVGLNAVFYDVLDNCIFGSINNNENEYYGTPMDAGKYRSICKIPGNLFNNGIFKLGIYFFGRNFMDAVMVKDVLKLEILDGISVRKDYHGIYEGVLRPLLTWKTVRFVD